MQDILQRAAALQKEIDELEVLDKEMSNVGYFFQNLKDELPEISDEINSVVYGIKEFDIDLDAGLEKLRELFNQRAHLLEKKKELSVKWETFIKDDPRDKLKVKKEELADLLRGVLIFNFHQK